MPAKTSTNHALPKGTVLAHGSHSYRIIGLLGSGGFGITYLVEMTDSDSGKTYRFAMKEHFPSRLCVRARDGITVEHRGADAEEFASSLRDFKSEVRRLRQLSQHQRNIVYVHNIFEANCTAYYIMEYLPGETLSDYTARRGKLDESAAIDIMRQVAGAVNYMHSNHMTHLDIKPENIMLT